MSRSVIETVIGGFVILGAVIFLIFSYSEGDAKSVTGYKITADFSKIGGLMVGDAVQISGVKVGQVAAIELDPQSYLARITMEIDNKVKVPDDSAATISSQSLLGGMYMSIEPGGSETMLKDDEKIQYTQAPQNLEELLGKFIFSMQGNKSGSESGGEAPVTEPAAADNHVSMPESP